MTNFLHCLFDPQEGTCLTGSPKGTEVLSVESADSRKHAFFSINPLHLIEDRAPTETWHAPNLPRRCDFNVVAFRNILIEMDGPDLTTQEALVKAISLPYSTAVFSGSKSIHYIISLESSLPSRVEYDNLVYRIYRAVGMDKIDRTCKNPSRLSRLPGYVRTDTGNVQQLLAVNGRINSDNLESWLLSRGVNKEQWVSLPKRRPNKDFSALTPFTKNFLTFGALEGNRNISLFKAAVDLCRNGWDQDEIYELCRTFTTLPESEARNTIHSAFKNEERKYVS